MIRTLALTVSVALFASSAMAAGASGTCSKASADKFKPQADLITMLKGEGMTVNKVKVENGCYEVYAKDKAGKMVNVAYNAETLDKMGAAEAGEAVKQ